MARSKALCLCVALAAALPRASGHADGLQASPQLASRHTDGAALVDAAGAAVASATAQWPTRFVGRVKRADGTPLPAAEVLAEVSDAGRVVADLRRELGELRSAASSPDTDRDTFLDRLDALAETAILTPWQLSRSEAHLAIGLGQTEYDDAVAAARQKFGQTSGEAYADAEWQARHTATLAYSAATDALVAARRRARLAFERWAAGVSREATTRRAAEALETHLNVSPGCDAAVKTSLDRFLCEHEIIFAGAPEPGEAPRASMAQAFDAFDVEIDPVPVGDPATYPSLEPEESRFVAGYESLQAPIWPPERYPWARDLPASVATALERGSRLLLFHGRDLVPVDGTEPAIASEDPRIVYQLLATARAGVAEEHQDPVVWDGYMRGRWSQAPWLALRRGLIPLDAPPEWVDTIDRADLVMVLARVLPGTLPGQKNLRLAGVPAYWTLPTGNANADVHFVRERVPDDFEPVRHGFLGERLHVAVRLDVEVALDEIPVAIVADESTARQTREAAAQVGRTLVARRDQADRRLYVSEPFGLAYLPDYIRIPSPGVIPAHSGDGLAAGIDTHEVSLRRPGRMTVLRDPDSLPHGWRKAVETVAALKKTSVGPDFRAFLRTESDRFTTHLRYRLPRTVTGTADAELASVDVTVGHHAALLLLRDELIAALKEVDADLQATREAYERGDLRARAHLRQLEKELTDPASPWHVVPVNGPVDYDSLPRPGNFELAKLGDFVSAARREVPLSRIIDEVYLTRHFEPHEAQRWRVTAAAEGITYFQTALQASIRHAQLVKDDDLPGLLALVRFGFQPIVARVLPDTVMPALAGAPTPWRSDPESRQYIRGVLDLAARYGEGREIGSIQRSVTFAALALATVVAAPEAIAFRVLQVASAGLGAADLAAFTIPDYLRRRAEVTFALGASPLLGADRLRWAEARAIPAWSVALDAALLSLSGAADLNALVGQIRVTRDAARTTALLNRIRNTPGIAGALDTAEEARYLAMLGDALVVRQAGRPLTPVQRLAIEAYESRPAVRARAVEQARRARDLPPGWHVGRAGGRRVSTSPLVPPGHYPPALRRGTPMTVVAVDADGQPIEYQVGNLIGSGTASYVYECVNRPGVVLKFPHQSRNAADWLAEATRVDALLGSRGIRHLPILGVAPDAPVPFYVQARLPQDARRFATDSGIVGYEIVRPGTIVPPGATPDDLRKLSAGGLVRLQYGYSLAGGGTLPRPIQRALLRLYKRVAQAGLIAEDLHLDNLYFVRQGLRWEAGVLDLQFIGPWNGLLDTDQILALKVLDVEELADDVPRLLPSMTGRRYVQDMRARLDAGAERLYPDPDFFMEKMLEYKWYIRYLPAEQRWLGSMLDLDVVEEYFPNFRAHVAPDMVALADRRALGVPGPRVEVDVDPVPARPWPESVGPRGPPPPPDATPTPRPGPVNDPNAPTTGRPGTPAAAPPARRPPPQVGIPESAIGKGPRLDLVYGMYRKAPDGLPEWARRHGAGTLDDLDQDKIEIARASARDPGKQGSEARLKGGSELSVASLMVAADEGRTIHFDLNGLDLAAPWTPGHAQFDRVTSVELRYIRARWDDFDPKPKFYLDGKEVRAPWLDLPTRPPGSGGRGGGPPAPGGAGPAPQRRPFGLSDPAPPEPPNDPPPAPAPTATRTSQPPPERQRRRELDVAERWQRNTDAARPAYEANLATAAAALREAQEAAPRFDVSRIPPHRGTEPRRLSDGLAPVRTLVPGDTAYVGVIMSGAQHQPSQPDLAAHLINQYVAQILAGGPFPTGAGGRRIQIDAQNIIQDGHHRYVAAQIVRRLTGRPLFTGAERIIPEDAVEFLTETKARSATSWQKLGIRAPREQK